MSITLELAVSMLTKFDGNKSKLFEFIDNCDKAYKLVKTESKTILFNIIETKLTDNARAVTRNRNFEDWDSLKRHLLDVYSEKRTMGQWQLELNSCRQNQNEGIMSYSSKIESCYLKLINSLDENLSKDSREACIKLLKEQALSVFITGLKNDLQILVKSQRPETLEKGIAIALQEEQELKSKQEIFKYQNIHNSHVRHCNLCNKPGHTSFSCRYNTNKHSEVRHIQNKPQNFKFNHNNSNNTHQTSNSNYNNYNSNFNKFCNYCKKKGHLINECRKREYINKKKANENQIQQQSNTVNQITLPELQNLNLNAQGSRKQAISRNAQIVQAEFQQ